MLQALPMRLPTLLAAALVAATTLSTPAARADGGGVDRDAASAAAGDAYLLTWTESGRAACEARQPECQRMAEVLYNAARAYQAAHLPPRAIAARQELLNPRYHLDHTELAQRAVREIGQAHQALGNYDEAATWFERFARVAPKLEGAPGALQDAVVLRLGLGQNDQAIADADLYNKNYGGARPAETARVDFAIGAHLLAHDQPEAARKRLAAAMPAIDRNATVDVQLQAHATLARALAQLGKVKEAAAEYEKVRAQFRGAKERLAKMAEGESGDLRALGKALNAAGEAAYFFAEEKRREAEGIPLRRYAGAARRTDAVAYFVKTVAPWLQQRRLAIEVAEKAYREVLSLEPMPPPRWVIDGAAQVGRMRGRLAAELLTLPMPQAWRARGAATDEVREAWAYMREEVSEPERLRARGAFRGCVDLSTKYQYTDDLARGCSAWLSRHFPAEHPRLDEIADRPTRLPFTLVVPYQPLPEP